MIIVFCVIFMQELLFYGLCLYNNWEDNTWSVFSFQLQSQLIFITLFYSKHYIINRHRITNFPSCHILNAFLTHQYQFH